MQDGNYIQAGVSVDDPEYAIPEGLKRVEVCLQLPVSLANIQPVAMSQSHMIMQNCCFQVYMGSGWFVEPYKGSSNSTLVTYIGNVRNMSLLNYLLHISSHA